MSDSHSAGARSLPVLLPNVASEADDHGGDEGPGEEESLELLEDELRMAEDKLGVEEGELSRLKNLTIEQQKRVLRAADATHRLRKKVAEIRNREKVDTTSAAEAAQFSMEGDDTDEEESGGGGAVLDGLDFDTPLDAIGVAKCGRCGARLPLDTDAIEAHTVECERNSVPNPKAGVVSSTYMGVVKHSIVQFLKSGGRRISIGGGANGNASSYNSSADVGDSGRSSGATEELDEEERGNGGGALASGGPSSAPSHGRNGTSTRQQQVTSKEAAAFVEMLQAELPSFAPGDDDKQFVKWLRMFHSEFSDERFVRNLPRLKEAFSAVWREVRDEVRGPDRGRKTGGDLVLCEDSGGGWRDSPSVAETGLLAAPQQDGMGLPRAAPSTARVSGAPPFRASPSQRLRQQGLL